MSNGKRRLAYAVGHEQWWARMPDFGMKPEHPEVFVHCRYEDSERGTDWEFGVRWHDFGSNGGALRVEVFNDAWVAYADWPEFFAALASDDRPATLDQLRLLLDHLGVEDITDRVAPKGTCDSLRRLADDIEGIAPATVVVP
jgi:hypothetical protein